MDAKERARLRALRETIPAGDVAPCCERAGQDGHHSSWALGATPHGAAIRAWVAGPLDLLALARTALPALLDDSERLDAATHDADAARELGVRTGLDVLDRCGGGAGVDDRCPECGAPWSAHREIDAATCGGFAPCPSAEIVAEPYFPSRRIAAHGHHCTLAPGHAGPHHTAGCDRGAT